MIEPETFKHSLYLLPLSLQKKSKPKNHIEKPKIRQFLWLTKPIIQIKNWMVNWTEKSTIFWFDYDYSFFLGRLTAIPITYKTLYLLHKNLIDVMVESSRGYIFCLGSIPFSVYLLHISKFNIMWFTSYFLIFYIITLFVFQLSVVF